MMCVWAAPPTRTSRGLRAYQGVDAHIQRFACEQYTEIDTESAKVQTYSDKTAYFWLLSPNGSALWRPHRHQTGGELHYTRVRHADDTPTEGFM